MISYLINPMFSGAPAWPNTRQAYRVIRTADSLIVASDGLSDPFAGTDMTDTSGFGLEVYLEIMGAARMPFDQVQNSPVFRLIENVAHFGTVTDMLAQYGVISLTVPLAQPLAPGWQDENDNVGVLLGMPVTGRPTQIELPFGPYRFVPVTPIPPASLPLISSSRQARNDLAQRLAASSAGWRFDPRLEAEGGLEKSFAKNFL
ncbi:hypothetical protein ACU81Q_12995 [Komagataeibacter melomenusus]